MTVAVLTGTDPGVWLDDLRALLTAEKVLGELAKRRQ